MTSPLYAFEITLQSQPAEATAGPPLADAWGTWPTLDVPKELLASPMAIGFDAAFERLAAIERLYAEPDGSFVWMSPALTMPSRLANSSSYPN
jgi:hypothetical protein